MTSESFNVCEFFFHRSITMRRNHFIYTCSNRPYILHLTAFLMLNMFNYSIIKSNTLNFYTKRNTFSHFTNNMDGGDCDVVWSVEAIFFMKIRVFEEKNSFY